MSWGDKAKGMTWMVFLSSYREVGPSRWQLLKGRVNDLHAGEAESLFDSL